MSMESMQEMMDKLQPLKQRLEKSLGEETESYYCPDYPTDELIKPCDCDKCAGACNNGNGGTCGKCFACEELADNEKFWQANREDLSL